MICSRCGAEMEPIPEVGWVCPACLTEAQGRGCIRITVGPEGIHMDAGGMTSAAVISILQRALQTVVVGHIQAGQRAAKEN